MRQFAFIKKESVIYHFTTYAYDKGNNRWKFNPFFALTAELVLYTYVGLTQPQVHSTDLHMRTPAEQI